MDDALGVLSLLPALVVISAAVLSRRPLASLLFGVIVGLLLLSPGEVLPNFTTTLLRVMQSETMAWIILVCGLIGSLIVVLNRSGAASSFADMAGRFAVGRRSTILSTWLLGLCIFIDDYLNALAVSSSMKRLFDRHKISRPMLAYVVDATAAPICILVPLSTWAIFFVGVIESAGVAAEGEGFALYLSAIPYMLYAWITVILVPLVGLGYVPVVGAMRRAEQRAVVAAEEYSERHAAEESGGTERRVSPLNFVLPLLSLVFFSIVYDIDVLVGAIVALAITVPLLGIQRILPWTELFESVLDGVKLMVPALAIVAVAFVFQDINAQLGMPEYVAEAVAPMMSPKLLPAITFITMGLVAFATGSFWGILVIAVPVIVPIAVSLEVSIPLVLGALLSASSFGSHACFYSDSTVLAAQGSECEVVEHAFTQLPYVLIAAVLSVIGLTILA